jgi:hypothetical protein
VNFKVVAIENGLTYSWQYKKLGESGFTLFLQPPVMLVISAPILLPLEMLEVPNSLMRPNSSRRFGRCYFR